MRVVMIAPLGTTPAVITEMVRFLEAELLTDAIIFPTSEDSVKAGARLVEAALKVHYPKLRVHIHFLPLNDVASQSDMLIVGREMSKAICKEKLEIGTDKIFLDVAGGRKEVTILTAMLGTLFGVTRMYHVINREITDFNEYQHAIKKEIMKFTERDLKKRVEMYKQEQDKFDYLLFPETPNLEFINIPVIPYSPKDISRLKRILKTGGISIDEENIPEYILKMYQMAGLCVYEKSNRWISPTELGLEIGKMLRCEYLK